MENKMLVDKFKNLVNNYKVDKITKLINGDSASKNPNIKSGIKGFLNGLSTENKEKFEVAYLNALEPVNLKNIESLLTKTYNFDFSDDFCEWMEYQHSEEYKSQSLRSKIANKVKKGIKNLDTKVQVKQILNDYKLAYDLDFALGLIRKYLSGESLQNIEEQQELWFKRLNEINDEFDYANWLDDKSSKAKDVSFATHIAKLTHSGISGASNVFFNDVGNKNFLSTGSLRNKDVEVSQSNNLLAPIGKLLQLHGSNGSLSEQLKQGDLTVFEEFSQNDDQLVQWRKGFKAVFEEKDLATHYLSKQIYFPINNNDHCDDKNYHLINPMMSSSLDQIMFEKVNFAKYSKEIVEIRKQKRNGEYHQDIQLSFPDLAVLKVTASNDGNASPLNGKRSGKRYLFPSMPPTWQKTQTPPLKQESLFAAELNKRTWQSTKQLQKYLIKLQTREFGNKVIRDQVKQHINNIINTLFDYVLEVQAMPSGWSENSKLEEKSPAHSLWLDINRDDKTFQEKRKGGQWQEALCRDFGSWISARLSNKEMKLVKFEDNKWAKLLKSRLNLFNKGWEESK